MSHLDNWSGNGTCPRPFWTFTSTTSACCPIGSGIFLGTSPCTIRDVVELGPNETKIVTETGEYVFIFEERNTLVSAAAEFVKTGVLRLLHNSTPVLHLDVSPPDFGELGNSWVARGIEEFRDGKWVAELTQLHSRLVHYETEQKKKDELAKKDELKGVAELKEKLSKLPPARVEPKSWFLRLLRRLGG